MNLDEKERPALDALADNKINYNMDYRQFHYIRNDLNRIIILLDKLCEQPVKSGDCP